MKLGDVGFDVSDLGLGLDLDELFAPFLGLETEQLPLGRFGCSCRECRAREAALRRKEEPS